MLGADLELVRRDTGVDPQEARTVATQLGENDDAAAIVGLFSSEINPLWDFLQDLQTPIVTPWPGSTFLDTRGGDKGTPDDVSDDEWVWRTVVGDTVHTGGSAVYALEEGFETLGIINGNTEGEWSYVDGFLSVYEENGGTVAERVEVEWTWVEGHAGDPDNERADDLAEGEAATMHERVMDGESVYVVEGNTYPHRKEIGTHGLRWSPERGAFVTTDREAWESAIDATGAEQTGKHTARIS